MVDLDRLKATLSDLPIHGGISATTVGNRIVLGVDGLTVSIDNRTTVDEAAVAVRKAVMNRAIAAAPVNASRVAAPLEPPPLTLGLTPSPTPPPARPQGKQLMSLKGKLAHLTETATDFNKRTGEVLDEIGDKIAVAAKKRDEAAARHHAYYNEVIKGVDESVNVIERLSNAPLDGES